MMEQAEGRRQKAEGWQRVKLGEVCTLNPREDAQECSGEFLKMEDVAESGHIQSVSHIEAEKFGAEFSKFRNGDSLVAKITPCFENRKGTFVRGMTGLTLGSTEFYVLRAKKNIAAEYLFLLTRTEPFFIRGEANMQGSGGQRRVPSEFIKAFPILLPPLPEQRKIAAILGTWDGGLATLAALVAAKREQKRGLAQLLLTGEQRLSGFTGEWQTVRLGDISNYLGRGKAPKYTEDETDTFAINQKCVRNGQVNTELARRHDAHKTIPQSVKLKNGDICVNSTGTGTIGRVGLLTITQTDKVYFPDTHVTLLRCKPRLASAKFLTDFLQLETTQSLMERQCIYGSSSQVELSRSDFEALTFQLPPLPEQSAIAGVLSTLDAEIMALEGLRERLQEQKRGLMDELLTGRTRVRV